MTSLSSWKNRIYSSYISRDQLVITGGALEERDPDKFFQAREHRVRRVISRHLPPDRASRILDLGCGHGAYLYYLRAAGYTNIAGADVAASQVAVAHRLGIKEAECMDMLPYLQKTESQSADAVLLIDILEHLTREELFETLDEVFRVLRPGGKCLAHVPNAEGIYGMRIRYGDLTHENCFTPNSAKQLLYAIGFEDVQCFEDEPEPHGLTSFIRLLIWKVGTLPHRLMLSAEMGESSFVLSQNMLVTAVKP